MTAFKTCGFKLVRGEGVNDERKRAVAGCREERSRNKSGMTKRNVSEGGEFHIEVRVENELD